jgi:hypothetical protein
MVLRQESRNPMLMATTKSGAAEQGQIEKRNRARRRLPAASRANMMLASQERRSRATNERSAGRPRAVCGLGARLGRDLVSARWPPLFASLPNGRLPLSRHVSLSPLCGLPAQAGPPGRACQPSLWHPARQAELTVVLLLVPMPFPSPHPIGIARAAVRPPFRLARLVTPPLPFSLVCCSSAPFLQPAFSRSLITAADSSAPAAPVPSADDEKVRRDLVPPTRGRGRQ